MFTNTPCKSTCLYNAPSLHIVEKTVCKIGQFNARNSGSSAIFFSLLFRQTTKKTRIFRADFWEGDATKHFSVKKKVFFSEKGGGNSVNRGFGKDFYRKGNSVKKFGPFTEPPDSEN